MGRSAAPALRTMWRLFRDNPALCDLVTMRSHIHGAHGEHTFEYGLA